MKFHSISNASLTTTRIRFELKAIVVSSSYIQATSNAYRHLGRNKAIKQWTEEELG